MQLKPIVIGLTAATLAGCATTNTAQVTPGDESLQGILSQYDSNKYVIVSDVNVLSAAERSKLENDGYKLLKTDRVDDSGYLIAPVEDADFSTSTLRNYMTRDGINYRFLNSVPAEQALVETAIDPESSDGIIDFDDLDDPYLLASIEDSVDQELMAANLDELEDANQRALEAEERLAEAQLLAEAKSEELEEMRQKKLTAIAEAIALDEVRRQEKMLEELEAENAITFKWFAGETLQQSLRRWTEEAGYNQLVWYVYDPDGDVIEIPIASDHEFSSDFQTVLTKVKRAYATAPRNPINLDFIIKQGNKTVIVTNAGAAR